MLRRDEAMRTLVLGLGNELLGDDGVGALAARTLKAQLDERSDVDVVESPLCGLALLDLLLGYDRALILDAIMTGMHPPGTIIELGPEDLDPVCAPSPHYAGLPEIFSIAEQLALKFPQDIRILAVEVEDPYTLGAGLSSCVTRALETLVRRVQTRLTCLAPSSSTGLLHDTFWETRFGSSFACHPCGSRDPDQPLPGLDSRFRGNDVQGFSGKTVV